MKIEEGFSLFLKIYQIFDDFSKLLEMKNEKKNYFCSQIPKIGQILKHFAFARQFHSAYCCINLNLLFLNSAL